MANEAVIGYQVFEAIRRLQIALAQATSVITTLDIYSRSTEEEIMTDEYLTPILLAVKEALPHNIECKTNRIKLLQTYFVLIAEQLESTGLLLIEQLQHTGHIPQSDDKGYILFNEPLKLIKPN